MSGSGRKRGRWRGVESEGGENGVGERGVKERRVGRR